MKMFPREEKEKAAHMHMKPSNFIIFIKFILFYFIFLSISELLFSKPGTFYWKYANMHMETPDTKNVLHHWLYLFI